MFKLSKTKYGEYSLLSCGAGQFRESAEEHTASVFMFEE
jgi:hypothetical protein